MKKIFKQALIQKSNLTFVLNRKRTFLNLVRLSL